jgi:ATP-dependent RNA helicase RhlE
MLDMGFIHDVRKIVSKLPASRQTMFFSATLSEEITTLAADMLRNPARVAVTPPASVSVKIKQQVFFVEQADKRALLSRLLKKMNVQRALVFTRTKHRANRIMQQLANEGITAEAIHSNKSQNARQRALEAFDRGRVRVLVATDIVARGIDVEGISHVINFELPNEPESYVHRIGRTARAGAAGIALSFCCAEEVELLKGIERLTKCLLTADEDHFFHSATTAALYKNHAASPGLIPRPESHRQPRPQMRHGRTSWGQRSNKSSLGRANGKANSAKNVR